MKSKLAIWSLVLPILLIVIIGGIAVLKDIGEVSCGGFYGYEDDTFLCKFSMRNSDFIVILSPLLISSSLVFGISAIKEIKRNTGLKGKGLAIAGIILSLILLPFSLFGAYLALVGFSPGFRMGP